MKTFQSRWIRYGSVALYILLSFLSFYCACYKLPVGLKYGINLVVFAWACAAFFVSPQFEHALFWLVEDARIRLRIAEAAADDHLRLPHLVDPAGVFGQKALTGGPEALTADAHLSAVGVAAEHKVELVQLQRGVQNLRAVADEDGTRAAATPFLTTFRPPASTG